tara:strand:+ start:7965 stop:8171 length:207 start_codon:yes stop_codon:yes gene_type:complete
LFYFPKLVIAARILQPVTNKVKQKLIHILHKTLSGYLLSENRAIASQRMKSIEDALRADVSERNLTIS